jgi:hypothetical protein
MDFSVFNFALSLREGNATRAQHQIHHHFVRYANYRELTQILVCDLAYRLVWEHLERRANLLKICVGTLDEEVYVLRRPRETLRDNGKTADHQISRALTVQAAADEQQVVPGWRA